MRPVNKGNAPSTYSDHRDARDDLCRVIGWYCSYCEMKVTNMIEVEHITPIDHGGDRLNWSNFLLSCRYCNGTKKSRNTSREGYFWPDSDNTLRAFRYQKEKPISPASDLSQPDIDCANATICLYGLHREPSSAHPPTKRDTRWFHRRQAWEKAERALDRWRKCPTPEMMEQIVEQASDCGFFSVWMEVFREEAVIRQGLIAAFTGTEGSCFDSDTQPLRRANGRI